MCEPSNEQVETHFTLIIKHVKQQKKKQQQVIIVKYDNNFN